MNVTDKEEIKVIRNNKALRKYDIKTTRYNKALRQYGNMAIWQYGTKE